MLWGCSETTTTNKETNKYGDSAYRGYQECGSCCSVVIVVVVGSVVVVLE